MQLMLHLINTAEALHAGGVGFRSLTDTVDGVDDDLLTGGVDSRLIRAGWSIHEQWLNAARDNGERVRD